MILGTFDTNLIPSPSIREYFEEVLANYTNGHNRSAIVLLYSVVITDLMQKLKNLHENFNDTKAQSILSRIESKKESNPKDSSWENDVIDSVLTTSIVSTEVSAKLQHLKDQRNLAAHPVLNEDFELIKPSKETVIDFISFFYEKLLTVPAHFMGNIVSKMTDDLAKYNTCVNENPNYLDKHILNNYVARCNESSFIRIFKAFWKFVFKDNKTPTEIKYQSLNFFTLNVLSKYGKDWSKTIIQSGDIFQTTSTDNEPLKKLFSYFMKNYDLYAYMNDGWKSILNNFTEYNPNYVLCSWFKTTPKDHLDSIINNTTEFIYLATLNKKYIDNFFEFYESMGTPEKALDAFITIFAKSGSYDATKNLYDNMIYPHLNSFMPNQFSSLLEAMNTNDQIYGRDRSIGLMLDEIKKSYNQKFTSDLDLSNYPNLILI